MFGKVLVANRGEIAVRIIRACRELGISTVAVFSEADRQSLHVRYADEAYCLGPAPSRDSYLRGDKIIEIAKKTHAEAVHPGYGFLAERSDFAQACLDADLIFIGPKPSAIAAMGDKAVARATVSKAGVTVVPGTEGEGALSDDELLSLAPTIGLPLLIKATAGGGGKGMREVTSLDEMPQQLLAARREAEASFGDGNVYLEKLVEGARHIEFQILADAYGQAIHLGERECSLQRRHQKLLEESPSPLIGEDETLRREMGAVAVRAAQAVDYVNAGTIEFLVDAQMHYYFLEMNTRLQVEHPVTELVTGIDIVKEQIAIAQGYRLRYSQDDIAMNGWAIECRINAEDPYRYFMPSMGKITHMILPGGPGVRIDAGVYAGCEISPYYDALLAKLIVWGETRMEAILRMQQALKEYKISGIRTNIPFHQNIIDSPMFKKGQFDTRSIEDRNDLMESTNPDNDHPEIAAIMATIVEHQEMLRATHAICSHQRNSRNWKWIERREQMHR